MKSKILFSAVALITLLSGYSQTTQIRKADQQYDKLAYIDAIKIYERVAEKGHKSVDLFEKLGNAYYFNAELEPANKWYTALFELNQPIPPEYYYRYSQTLKSVGDYTKANAMLEEFNTRSGNDQRAKLYESNKDYLAVIKANSGRFRIENAGINSEYSDYGTAFFDDQLVFASSREKPGITKRVQKWNNQAFTTLYAAKINGDGQLLKPEEFSGTIDSRFNEATPAFTPDGLTMYFTRNNYNDGKKGKDKKDQVLLKLYKATLENGKWKNVVELPFNSNNYSTAHPALSPDGKTLYFASNMPGTMGESDIFKVAINADGSYGKPENLGIAINTEGKETFPFVSADNELYFASDGHPGLGGLDIFVSRIMKDNTLGKVANVGAPVNGPTDDFAFMMDAKSRNGFFSSNREGGLGYDDIYEFTETRKLSCEQLLEGTITDSDTKTPLANAKVIVLDDHMKIVKESYADEQGYYSWDGVNCDVVYYVRAKSPQYETKEEKVTIPATSGKTDGSIALDKNIKTAKTGTDLATLFRISIIYFDLDKSNIRPDAALDISKVVEVMKEYPNMKIAIASHTDSRASKAYNMKLSERRAQATLEYMVQSGISRDRLTAKGYGETQLVNGCADGVPCTEAQHQENRRSQFIITSM